MRFYKRAQASLQMLIMHADHSQEAELELTEKGSQSVTVDSGRLYRTQ